MSRILIVDDDPQGLYMLEALLKGHGYEVETAVNGSDALEKARRNPPDAIVSDFFMPTMDGFALCRECKKDDRLKDAPFIAYTATYTDPKDEELALGLGAARFLVKPIEPDVLLREVERVLADAKAGRLLPPPEPALEKQHLWEYNEALIRKLEAKVTQLQETNRALQEEMAQRRQAEKSLQETEARYRALVELAPDAIFINRNNRIELVNAAALQLFGATTAEQLLGKSPLDLFHPDFHEIVRERIRTVLTGQSVPLIEEKVVRLDGAVRIAEVAASPFVDVNGVAIQVFLRDITNRKQAEDDLKQAAEELRQSNRDLEQFAYVASHDLQEPLRMVTIYMDLLETRYKGRLDKDADQFIDFAAEGAYRMQQLIADLLTYSRITSRKELRRVAVQAVFDRAVADLRGMIVETGAEITHDSLPEVLGDETQLGQLLVNLFSNAMKFRGDQPPRIHLGASLEQAEWVFSVRDNGIGIDPSNADHIFQVFQQLHTRQKYSGSGIGLAICKRIVEHHGGRIWVESQVGQGATFFFTWPA